MRGPRPGQIEVPSDSECVKLLRSHDLGRIAVVDREVRPLIFPINYFFDELVVVQGVAVDATDSFDDVSWAAHAATPWPLAPGAKPFRVGIEPSQITGRRLRRRA